MLTLLKKAKLADALLDDYPEVITGYIVDATVVSGCLVGEAYKTWGYATGEADLREHYSDHRLRLALADQNARAGLPGRCEFFPWGAAGAAAPDRSF